VRLRSRRMDWVVVLIQTRMMMTCNYNVQFHFVLGALSLALILWLQCDKTVPGGERKPGTYRRSAYRPVHRHAQTDGRPNIDQDALILDSFLLLSALLIILPTTAPSAPSGVSNFIHNPPNCSEPEPLRPSILMPFKQQQEPFQQPPSTPPSQHVARRPQDQ
jgi:hypothetical protein